MIKLLTKNKEPAEVSPADTPAERQAHCRGGRRPGRAARRP